MSATEWAALLTALGIGAMGKELVLWLIKAITGKASRRRSEVDRIAAEAASERQRRIEAEERADTQAAHKRIFQEYASRLRSAYYEGGKIPEDLPVLERTLTSAEIKALNKKE